jgi:hypothetical protein
MPHAVSSPANDGCEGLFRPPDGVASSSAIVLPLRAEGL